VRHAVVESNPHCPICQYDLSSLSEPRCPECGYGLSEAEWQDRSLLVLRPAWERRKRIGRTRAFILTVLGATFRPRRFLRRLRSDREPGHAILFFLVSIPAAWLLALLLFLAWKWHLYKSVQALPDLATLVVATFIRASSLMLTAIILWIPTLLVLDLVLWKNRIAFRLVGKAIVYTLSWWFLAATIMSDAGNYLIVDSALRSRWIDYVREWVFGGGRPTDQWGYAGWTWGATCGQDVFNQGGAPSEYYWPWICWLSAVLFSIQAVYLAYFVLSSSCALGSLTRKQVYAVLTTLLGGWLFAVYMLIFDRHFMLRFHLQFGVEEARGVFAWLFEVL